VLTKVGDDPAVEVLDGGVEGLEHTDQGQQRVVAGTDLDGATSPAGAACRRARSSPGDRRPE
jgi:hypothetical protein